MNQKTIIIAAAAFVVLVATAIGASYFTRTSLAPEEPPVIAQQAPAPTHHAVPQPQHAAARPPCNDHNIVGTAIGAVGGGVLGNQFGKGAGKTVATVGGAAAGGYLGNEYVPTRGATCD